MFPRSMSSRGRAPRAAGVAALCAALSACLSCTPADYRHQADQTADGIIKSQQAQAIGRSEPFTIETPANTLRKRLMMSQLLPYAARASLGVDEIPPLENWPDKNYPPRPPAASQPASAPAPTIHLSLLECLQVAAGNNRDYQTNKENVYEAALNYDLQAFAFRDTFAGTIDTAINTDLSSPTGLPVNQLANSAQATWQRKLENGAQLTSHLALDLVKLLSRDHGSSEAIALDGTVTVPLLRGSGREIVTEPMTLAQREVVYSIATLERFKETLAVQVANGYFAVLQQQDQVVNNAENYKNLILSTRRARRLADAGRMSQVDLDQARQSELTARLNWIAAMESYDRQLDSFKSTLGLPTDCSLELDASDLDNLAKQARTTIAGAVPVEGSAAGAASAPAPASLPAFSALQVPPAPATGPAWNPWTSSAPVFEPVPRPTSGPSMAVGLEANAPVVLVPPSRQGGGPLEMDPNQAVLLALANRLDLRNTNGQVYDAQRAVLVAADALRAGLTLTAAGQAGGRRGFGTADEPGVGLHFDRGVYAGGALLDLPLERTPQRDAYRSSLISLAQAARSSQQLEDTVKFQVRDDLRNLIQSRESYRIQVQAVALAERRVRSTQLFLEAGRAQMRDVLDAQQSLLDAQNGLSAALVNYRVAELSLQRDMGLLQVDEKGIWCEYKAPSNP
jgi:outer membrane protein TolC